MSDGIAINNLECFQTKYCLNINMLYQTACFSDNIYDAFGVEDAGKYSWFVIEATAY